MKATRRALALFQLLLVLVGQARSGLCPMGSDVSAGPRQHALHSSSSSAHSGHSATAHIAQKSAPANHAHDDAPPCGLAMPCAAIAPAARSDELAVGDDVAPTVSGDSDLFHSADSTARTPPPRPMA
ncbi:MAG: hypothetical protein ACREMQ_03065 [Longimicrobiales bacterium]